MSFSIVLFFLILKISKTKATQNESFNRFAAKRFFFTTNLDSINEFAKFSFVYLGRSNKIV